MPRFVVSRFLVLVVAAALAAAACHKAPPQLSRDQEVATCSAMSVDTAGTADCLVRLHGWKPDEAMVAARARQHVLDSTRAWQEDSAWRTDIVQHRRDVARCKGNGMARCLALAGWSDARAKRTADSSWDSDKSKHARQVADCARRSRGNPASCLMLSYQWDPDRAMPAADTVMRARMARPYVPPAAPRRRPRR
jgi:hypothetical protein